MKRKKWKSASTYIFPILLIIMVEVLFWLWQPYHKQIITIEFIYNAVNELPNVVTCVFYYLIYICLYICLAHFYLVNTASLPITLMWRKYIPLLPCVIGLRLVIDIVKILTMFLLGQQAVILSNFIEVVFIFLMLFLIIKIMKRLNTSPFGSNSKGEQHKQKNTLLQKMIIYGSITIIVLCFLWTMITNLHFNNLMNHMSSKYVMTDLSSSTFNLNNIMTNFGVSKNFRFASQFNSMVLNAVTSICIFIIYIMKKDSIKNGRHRNSTNDKSRGTLFISRIILVLVVLGFVTGFKVIFLSESMLSVSPWVSNSYGCVDEINNITYEKRTQSSFRKSTNNLNEKNTINVYTRTEFIIKFNNKQELFAFNQIDGNYSISSKGNLYHAVDNIEKIPINNVQAFNCGNAVLIISYDNSYLIISAENITKQKENEYLIKTLEILIHDGNWDMFENGYKFLLKYDREFIVPYIERYSKGEFTQEEQQKNAAIKPSYMIEFSQKALEKTK